MDIRLDIELPSPPQTALRLIQLCSDPEADMQDIVDTVSLDAALSANFLKVANSAYYGQQYEVATLRRATVVLGMERVKVIALGFHLAELSKQSKDLPIDLRPFWQGNVLRACLARQIAIHSPIPAVRCREEAFLVGLLQDFALPILAKAIGESYALHLGGGGLHTSEDILAFEEQAIGSNHAHLAGRMFDSWRFPPILTFAITNHHVKPQELMAPDKAMALWQIAYWVGAIPFHTNQQSAPVVAGLRQLALGIFGLDVDTLGYAFYQAIDEYETVKPVFSGLLPRDVDAPSIMQQARELILELDGNGVQGSQHESDAP